MATTQELPKLGATKHTLIVEHLDPELEAWQILEYSTISSETRSSGATFILSGLPPSTLSSEEIQTSTLKNVTMTSSSVEELMAAHGITKDRVCLLDPKGEQDLSPEDAETFDVFVFGGILGDEPPRDRTAELRVKGFKGRRLGKEQMSTDTAARVTRIVVQDGVPLDKVPYVERPDIQIAKGETINLPFRYVRGKDGRPVIPEGMLDLLAKDSDKGILDLL